MMHLMLSISFNANLSKKKKKHGKRHVNLTFSSESTWSFLESSFSLILVLLAMMNVCPQNLYLHCTANLNYWYYQHLHLLVARHNNI